MFSALPFVEAARGFINLLKGCPLSATVNCHRYITSPESLERLHTVDIDFLAFVFLPVSVFPECRRTATGPGARTPLVVFLHSFIVYTPLKHYTVTELTLMEPVDSTSDKKKIKTQGSGLLASLLL